MSVQVTFS